MVNVVITLRQVKTVFKTSTGLVTLTVIDAGTTTTVSDAGTTNADDEKSCHS